MHFYALYMIHKKSEINVDNSIKNDPAKVSVIVAEKVIGASEKPSHQKYAQLLRRDDLVRNARVNERSGIYALLDGEDEVR